MVVRGKQVITTNPDASQPCPDDKVNREFVAQSPNQLRVSDFTYVSTAARQHMHSMCERGGRAWVTSLSSSTSSLAAYQLGNNSYLVIDKGAAPVLEEMARVQSAPREERQAFIENPRLFITEAVNRHLEQSEAFQNLDAAAQEEMVEQIAGPTLIESREYSERLTGVVVYERPQDKIERSGTTWLPEAFAQHLA